MDATLLAARAEIDAILKKHDIAGWVVLHNAPGEIEAFNRLDPSYSMLRPQVVEGGGMNVRLLSKLSDYGGDRERQMRDQAATASMVHSFAEVLGGAALGMIALSEIVDRETGAEHTPLQPSAGKGH